MAKKRSKTHARIALMTVTSLVWITAVSMWSAKFRAAAKTAVKVQLTTTPASVRLQVNGEAQFDGLYVRTPATIMVPAGKSRLRIMRDGYASQLVNVTGNTGDDFRMSSIVLGRRPETQFVTAKVEIDPELPPGDKLNVDIHFGFVNGAPPYVVDDLEAGRDYLLVLTVATGEGKKMVHRCRFATEADYDSSMQALMLTVNKRGGRYFVSNCKQTNER